MNESTSILSEIVTYTKYARYIPELQRRETWDEIVARNISMHLKKYPHMAEEIGKAYQLVYDKKVLPSMRSLQFAGKAIEVNNSRIFNCAFIPIDDYFAFPEIIFMLLGGTGMGVSVQQHHIDKLPPIKRPTRTKRKHLVQDSIEGWADAVKVLVKAYFFGTSNHIFDYSIIRPKGSLLKTAGGKAPGPEPLKNCLDKIKEIFESKEPGDQLKPIEAHDIVCHLADAVLAGGIRRSALISLFSLDDSEMLLSKTGEWWKNNEQRGRANNSAVILRHRIKKNEFFDLWKTIKESESGEPGLFFSNSYDMGTNPCCEVSLRSAQVCNLVEINVSNIESQHDLNERAKAASLIATLQAGYTDFHYLRDIWKKTTEKEALLGVGITGIASGNVLNYDLHQAAGLVKQENERVAKLIGINKATRTTCVKPSGTSSLVLGTSSGIHAWHAQHYIRRMRVLKNESIYQYLKNKIPMLVEDDVFKPDEGAVISIPVKAPDNANFRSEPALNLLERVKKVSSEWIQNGHRRGDNAHNVSCTVAIKNDEWSSVGEWMWENRSFYNGLSVLPYDCGTYKQTPFEEITKEQYEDLCMHLNKIDLSEVKEIIDNTNLEGELACPSGGCEV